VTARSILVGLLLGLGAAAAADDVGKVFTDPVNGKNMTVAKETPFVAVNAKRLYFTEAKSREQFLKNPESYLKADVECPVRGLKRKASRANRLVVNDEIFYFCCGGCPMEFAKEPNSYVSELVDPVSGKKFNLAADSPKSSYRGGTYYFESAASKESFDKDPAKYARVVLQ